MLLVWNFNLELLIATYIIDETTMRCSTVVSHAWNTTADTGSLGLQGLDLIHCFLIISSDGSHRFILEEPVWYQMLDHLPTKSHILLVGYVTYATRATSLWLAIKGKPLIVIHQIQTLGLLTAFYISKLGFMWKFLSYDILMMK